MSMTPDCAGALARRIAHLDMDAFFASVELLRYPELRGQAVVIGGRSAPPLRRADGHHQFERLQNYVGRGVITTATYEARQFGVHSAMGMMKAAKLAPHAILLPVDFVRYRDYSRRFKEAVRQLAPHMEDRGIDEIYLDLTEVPGSDLELAQTLKQAVHQATGLTCSIAIAPNKLLAKIGSELDKPDGITLLSMEDLPTRIWPLPVRKINGIGPKAAQKLELMGIQTVGQLAEADPGKLQDVFGYTYASWLLQVSHGLDERPVVTYSEPKSVSRETTFARDLHPRYDRVELTEAFDRLCTQLETDLVRKQCLGRTVGIKLRFENFRTVTRDVTLPEHTRDLQQIRRAAVQCLRRVPLRHRIRLLGIRISNLVLESEVGGEGDDAGRQVQLSLY